METGARAGKIGRRQGADRYGGAATQTADNSGIEKDGKKHGESARLRKQGGARGEKGWQEKGRKRRGAGRRSNGGSCRPDERSGSSDLPNRERTRSFSKDLD